MNPTRPRDPLPPILIDEPSIAFLRIRRRFRALTGRELGFAHATRFLATYFSSWQELPLEGPDGLPLHLDLRQKEGYFNGGFTNTVGHIGPLLPYVKDGDVVVDVGANVGVWSRAVLAQRSLSHLYAFEPEGRNCELLAKNLARYPHASAQPYAVGAKSGDAWLSTHLDVGQNYVLPAGNGSRPTRRVAMVSLDDWARTRKIERLDVLKIDVEGLEADVLRGAAEVLRRLRPVVYFEFLVSPEHGDVDRASFEILNAAGYDIRAVTLDGRVVGVGSEIALSNDFIALPAGRGLSF